MYRDLYSPRCISPKPGRGRQGARGGSWGEIFHRHRSPLVFSLISAALLIGLGWHFIDLSMTIVATIEGVSSAPMRLISGGDSLRRPWQELQDPFWWRDPWSLNSSGFPKMSIYPDIDWNPRPWRMSRALKTLQPPHTTIATSSPLFSMNRRSPSHYQCNEESHPFYGDSIKPSLSGQTRSSPLLFLGIFSSVQSGKVEMRDLIRRRQLPHFYDAERYQAQQGVEGGNESHPTHTWGDMDIPAGILEWKFILGYPKEWARTLQMIEDETLALDEHRDPWMRRWLMEVPDQRGFVKWDGSSSPTTSSYGMHLEKGGQAGRSRSRSRDDKRFWSRGSGVLRRALPSWLGGWSRSQIDQAWDQIKTMRLLAQEQDRFGDLVLLDLEDNIVKGKTYQYFRWLAQTRAQDRPPRFAMKTDDDTFHVLPNLLSIFSPLSCQTSIYIGTAWGCSQKFPFHFGGQGYALSWPLIAWLGGGQELKKWETWGNEDARLGSYLLSLSKERDPVLTLDYSIQMGSWFDDWTFPKTTTSISLHYMKEPNVYRDYSKVMWDIWKEAGKEWKWTGGKDWVRRHARLP